MALKYNWGICVNNDKDDSGNPCSLCASKEKQKVENLFARNAVNL